ncbi:hypothetical protein E3T23_06540 [Cryobacterium cheniae]|uniref:Uncharacterized protein n=1 Tax=Cryobacterium cheniae TaxID=1259262 RepID=A0A4R8XUS2_9MICO|nr:hypothetical protein [Cryobacterium cheniae]TFC81150.1 hypothetical protein E3T23_06540 [Cryobacterium cheniae]
MGRLVPTGSTNVDRSGPAEADPANQTPADQAASRGVGRGMRNPAARSTLTPTERDAPKTR